jgi:sterol desaturase/sphingolipid hydroxylase (fatty acid hydroxylase superfamily)
MSHLEINYSPEPVRLFQSDFLEFFTHISPITITVIWLPVALYFLISAIVRRAAGAWLYIPLGLVIGLFVWTLSEYLLHRFVFHFKARAPWQERIIFLFHGIHHYQPNCKTRLVMPPVVSVPLAFVFYGGVYLIAGIALSAHAWVAPIFSGLIFGYLAYDLTHYATHHLPLKGRYLKYLKKYHMLHHFKTPEQRFGVSSPLWDFVFSTHPAD